MGSFVHTARILLIPHFMICIVHACAKDSFFDNFKQCEYAELDYTAHKIPALLCFAFCGIFHQSYEYGLLVKRRIKNVSKLCVFLLVATEIETPGFSVLLFCVRSRGHHQGPVSECEVQPP